MKPKILVVEDRSENLAVAREHYSQKEEKYIFDYAIDYDEAMRKFRQGSYNGVVTDCFMPKDTGSGDINLGLTLVNRLVPLTPEIEERRATFEKRLKSYTYLDVDNPEVQRTLYIWDGLPPLMEWVYKKADRNREDNTREYLKTFGYGSYSGENDEWGAARNDPNWILRQMIQQTEAAQPLGILIAEHAMEQEVPCCMLTARHDEIGEGVIKHWCKENSVSCLTPRESEKSDPGLASEYWGGALKSVTEQMDKV